VSEAQTSPGGVVTAVLPPGMSGQFQTPTPSQAIPNQNVIQEQMHALANILIDQFLATRKNGQRETPTRKANEVIQ
jgi:hypothetical protein